MTHVADIGQRTWQIQTDSTSMMVFLPGNENTTLKSSLTGHHIYTARAVPFFSLNNTGSPSVDPRAATQIRGISP